MALKLGELVAYLKGDNTNLKRTLAESKVETAVAGDAMSRSQTASATQTATAWSKAFTTQQASSRAARASLIVDIDQSRSAIRRLAAEFAHTRSEKVFGDLEIERSQLRTLTTALGELTTVGAAAATTGLGFVGKAVDFVAGKMTGWLPILIGVGAVVASIGPLGAFSGAGL